MTGAPVDLDPVSFCFREGKMNLLEDRINKIFPKYLFSALGSAIIMSIYTFIDAIMVGHYEGPHGASALAVVTPMYTVIFSIGLLFGIGGAVCMSFERGRGDEREGNRYFTIALLVCAAVSVLVWALLFLFSSPLLRLFGGEGETLVLAEKYFFYLRLGLPFFTMGQFLSCFVRNDGNPALATVAVLFGGVTNIVGDSLLVFVADLGISGAAIATIAGQALSVLILCGHFFSRRRRLAIVKINGVFRAIKKIFLAGLASFAADFSGGFLCILFNNRIMHYLGENALAVYGAVINLFFLIQSLAYGIGQAAQPILSVNFGAKRYDRVKKTLHLSVIASFVLGAVGLIVSEWIPIPLVKAFMDSTPEVEAIAPDIVRVYCLSFLFMPFNVFALYYFQAVLHSSSAWIVAFVRGILLSGGLVFLLPALFGGDMIWWAMLFAETLILFLNLFLIRRYSRFPLE